jgi:arginase
MSHRISAARILCVPYVVGRKGHGMGAGPLNLAAPAAALLGTDDVRWITLGKASSTEVSACFALNRSLAREVAAARTDGVLPVVLTGNCHSQQAVVAGLGTNGLGLVWFDCHPDFHTPETTESGYFDGYGLAMVVGDCWQTLSATVPGFTALPEDQVILVGARDIDDGERERLDRSAIHRVDAGDVGQLSGRLDRLQSQRISLHVDLDVLDPADGRANEYAVPPGVTADELIAAVGAIAREHDLVALTFSAYDPGYDADGRVRAVALAALDAGTRGCAMRLTARR